MSTNGNFNNLTFTGGIVYNLTTTYLKNTNIFTGTTEYIGTSNINNLIATGINVSVLTGGTEYIGTSNINNLIATGITVSVLTGGTEYIGTSNINNLIATGITFSIISGSTVYATNGNFNNLTGTNLNLTNLTVSNVTTGNIVFSAHNTLDDGHGNVTITPNNENAITINYTGNDFSYIKFNQSTNTQLGKIGFSNNVGIGFNVQNWTGSNILYQPADHSLGIRTFNNVLDDGNGNMYGGS